MIRLMCSVAAVAALTACGGGGGDSPPPAATATDNSARQASITSTLGYTGGNVEFGGQKIVGEWGTEKTLTDRGTGDAFKATSKYTVLSVKFDDVRYSEYWAEFTVVAGKVVSNAAWTPLHGYAVSLDGNVLHIDRGSEKRSYRFRGTREVSGTTCLAVEEQETGDQYTLCKKA